MTGGGWRGGLVRQLAARRGSLPLALIDSGMVIRSPESIRWADVRSIGGSKLQEQGLWTHGFGHWLAGFAAGEGCFSIAKRSGRGEHGYSCHFGIKLRADDRPVLEEIRARTGLGNLFYIAPPPPGNPQVDWRVANREGCLVMVEIFDQYDLRGKKDGAFFIWREAVREWTSLPTTNRGRDWGYMGELQRELYACRKYDAPAAGFVGRPRSVQLSFPG